METSSWADINVKRGHLLTSTMTGLFRACRADEAGGVEGPEVAGAGRDGGTVGLRMGVAPQLLLRLLTLNTTNKDPTTPSHTQSPQQYKQDTHTHAQTTGQVRSEGGSGLKAQHDSKGGQKDPALKMCLPCCNNHVHAMMSIS